MGEMNIDEKATAMFGGVDMECLIVDKVFAACQQRKCFPTVEAELKCDRFGRVKFKPGFIVPNTLVVTDTDTPNFRRVRFTLRIPYQILDSRGKVDSEGLLPDIDKDILTYIPDSPDEFEFRIVIETRSEVLTPPIITEKTINFTVGTFIIIKVVGNVQLLIPAFGYCPEPQDCTEFSPIDICDSFDNADFPEFFPPQLKC
ncbi:MAG: hypothetical protein M0Q14_00580 [Tissierellaceae bacterium]|nr:hypothetical protein [Tissierellaceae bacterium]